MTRKDLLRIQNLLEQFISKCADIDDEILEVTYDDDYPLTTDQIDWIMDYITLVEEEKVERQ